MSLESTRRSPRTQGIVRVPSFDGIGVTSLLPDPSMDGHRYYAGTKRGKVKRITLPADIVREDAPRRIRFRDVEDANSEERKPYLVFSMASVTMATTASATC